MGFIKFILLHKKKIYFALLGFVLIILILNIPALFIKANQWKEPVKVNGLILSVSSRKSVSFDLHIGVEHYINGQYPNGYLSVGHVYYGFEFLPSMKKIEEGLKSPDINTVHSALWNIWKYHQFNSPAIESGLLQLLNHKNGFTRLMAAQLLMQYGTINGVAQGKNCIQNQANSTNIHDVVVARDILERYTHNYKGSIILLSDDTAILKMDKILLDNYSWLGAYMENVSDRNTIEKNLYSSDDNQLIKAINRIGLLRYQSEKIENRLIELLGDKEERVRQESIITLTKIKSIQAIPHFNQLVRKDESPLIRFTCVCALGNLKDKSSIKPLLETAKKDSDILVRNAGLTVLKNVWSYDTSKIANRVV